jgi:protein-tyrosine phosphatase
VHCAAGKDRTGTVIALALSVAGADREAIVADYAASTERMEAILERLLGTRTYADNLRDRPMSSHITHPETMQAFLTHVDREYGGVEPLLARMGWTDTDSERLRTKLRD